ncbi:MAG: endonuclease III domain-containing protein [Vicinamibacterales bacterium]
MSEGGTRLERLVGRLKRFHGSPPEPPTRDPFRLIVWEQVGYLADDKRRLEAYRMLEERVGLGPADILHAPLATLRAVTRRGGAIGSNERASRLGASADRVIKKWDGNLKLVLDLPLAAARSELIKYPSIGGPGAERILLLTGAHPVLGLDSNALRVLQRLGYGDERAPWAQGYRQTQQAADGDLPRAVPIRRLAYLLLKHHGQTLCRRTLPRCTECPVLDDCPTGRDAVA